MIMLAVGVLCVLCGMLLVGGLGILVVGVWAILGSVENPLDCFFV